MSKVPVIVGLGETLWDVFPDGPRLGGAPLNFSCSTAELGKSDAQVFMISAVGSDELGHRAAAVMRAFPVVFVLLHAGGGFGFGPIGRYGRHRFGRRLFEVQAGKTDIKALFDLAADRL